MNKNKGEFFPSKITSSHTPSLKTFPLSKWTVSICARQSGWGCEANKIDSHTNGWIKFICYESLYEYVDYSYLKRNRLNKLIRGFKRIFVQKKWSFVASSREPAMNNNFSQVSRHEPTCWACVSSIEWIICFEQFQSNSCDCIFSVLNNYSSSGVLSWASWDDVYLIESESVIC